MTDSPWMPISEVAEVCKLSVSTTYTYAKEGLIPCQWRGNKPIFERARIERWQAVGTEEPQAPSLSADNIQQLAGALIALLPNLTAGKRLHIEIGLEDEERARGKGRFKILS